MKSVIAAFLFAVGMLAAAAPAHADNAGYLSYLAGDTYLRSHFSDQQLLAEGYKVCDAIHHSQFTDMQAVTMIQNDLSVSSSAAIDVYAAATSYLGC